MEESADGHLTVAGAVGAGSAASGPDAAAREADAARRRRPLLHDRRFRPSRISGLTSREFEVDLLLGETITGEPIRVRLTKTVSFWRRLALLILTLGLSEAWHRCCASGSRVFDMDARLAVTSRGRLLLWAHHAAGGGLPLCQHCLRACGRPRAIAVFALILVLIAFGPAFLGHDIVDVAGAVGCVVAFSAVAVLCSWLFERASLSATTSVRQFEARELSCARLVCYSWKSWFGLGGEVTMCQVHMFFGFYPKEKDLRRALPAGAFDSGTVRPGALGALGEAMGPSGLDTGLSKMQVAAGFGGQTHSVTACASALLILLAFAAFGNEAADFFAQWAKCWLRRSSAEHLDSCLSDRFRVWWTGAGASSWQTVASHWIEAMDWSLQILLFFYVIGPAASFLWSTLSEQSSAGIGFVVDRRAGTFTEDERFEEHWQEVADFLARLFEGAAVGCRDGGGGGGVADAATQAAGGWRETPPPPPGERAGWSRVEETTASLIEPVSGRVHVDRGVLSFLASERVLAVYPEKVILSIVVWVKIVLTCGLEYLCHWRRQRREGAIILTDRRLLQVSAQSSTYRRSLKVDMYAVGPSVKYVGMAPPRRLRCGAPQGRVAIATRCGLLEVTLLRMWRLRARAQQLWQSVGLLQDAPSVALLEFNDFASVLEGPDPAPAEPAPGDEAEEEARQEAVAIWDGGAGDVDEAFFRPSTAAASAGPDEERGGELALGYGKAQRWGLSLAEGERVLWGPCLFEQEVMRPWCCSRRSSARRRRRPSALVAITDRRLVVLQFRSLGPLGCGGVCNRVLVTSVAVVPLRRVLGFCIEETVWLQEAVLTRLLGLVCCWPWSESALTIRVLTNAGLGKVYLGSLAVQQRVLPCRTEAACSFEEDKVLELRRWLGNVALFFGNRLTEPEAAPTSSAPSAPLELWRCARGWAPA